MVSTAGGIAIAVVVLLLAAVIGWIVFTQLRARRLGVSTLSNDLMVDFPYLLHEVLHSNSNHQRVDMSLSQGDTLHHARFQTANIDDPVASATHPVRIPTMEAEQ